MDTKGKHNRHPANSSLQFELAFNRENGNGMKDPAWAENRKYAIHRWVPWVAGFSMDFVDDVLVRFLPKCNGIRPLVLDPFCGVGTTLVECLQRGVDSVGFEINPYAFLASLVKVDAFRVEPSSLAKMIRDYADHMRQFENEAAAVNEARIWQLKSHAPRGFRSKIPFFSDSVLSRVLATLEFAGLLKDETLRRMFLVALGSVMVKFSNYSYEPSLGTRPASGKPLIIEAPVCAIVVDKLNEMLLDVSGVHSEPGDGEPMPQTTVYKDSFFNARSYLGENSIDLVITSPPYLNNLHYVRNTRPQLWWLGLIQDQTSLKNVEESNMGKYWQTVRDRDPIALDIHVRSIENIVSEVGRRNSGRGSYGGQGWANYVATYFNDLAVFARLLSEVLKPGCRAVVVVGNSLIQGVEIKVDVLLSELAQSYNLTTDTIDTIREKRVGTSIIGSAVRSKDTPEAATLYDAAVVLRKPDAQ